ncbi:cobalt transporter CbiM [Clostridium sardiniense]|uniref:Cobalt transporter CbiM n=1 Tax=Clostridium sardiniense TaxID=29369 RepID=A0ABS7KZX8_CLOSR|nr:cobalt transporter CbiM [Clostridium sardiniense]MBY0756370.1 cobalt transporter CbiM [Clostridium sardiniense]MDQ0459216.1 cobalt/nickel transport system permease protein [Clostridium sardiniense]
MHIPENYLSPSTCAVMGAVMIPVWKHSISKVRRNLSKKKIPMLGVCAAFSFLLMMFNVPAPGGTSAHAVGAVLIAIMLGPASATIAVSIALLIQCLFFGDGGILAYGANTFNMAFIMPIVGYYTYTFLKSKFKSDKGEYVAVFLGSYLGLNIAALCAAIEFGIQPLLFKNSLGQPLYCPYSLGVSIPAMVSTHLLIGLLEGAVTVGVYAYIKKVSPEMIHDAGEENVNTAFKSSIIAIIVMIILTPIGLITSGAAWGEWGADEVKDLIGYIPKGMNSGFSYHALGDGYGFSGLGSVTGYILSAVIGVAVLIILFKVIASLKKE